MKKIAIVIVVVCAVLTAGCSKDPLASHIGESCDVRLQSDRGTVTGKLSTVDSQYITLIQDLNQNVRHEHLVPRESILTVECTVDKDGR
jgi:hypothetical protein